MSVLRGSSSASSRSSGTSGVSCSTFSRAWSRSVPGTSVMATSSGLGHLPWPIETGSGYAMGEHPAPGWTRRATDSRRRVALQGDAARFGPARMPSGGQAVPVPLTAPGLPDLPPELAGPVGVALAKPVRGIPRPDALPGGCRYEPKWDGYRLVVVRGSRSTRLWSKQGRDLTD